MGIAVSELLKMEYFKDFHVLAGKKGLHKEIQGITVLEAPDAPRWSRGKELIMSSGYVILKEPDCLQKAFQEGSLSECSAFMVKRGRYLEKIPEDIVALFERYEIPLISMPFSIPWMDVMNQINTAVMNRTIRRFRIQGGEAFQPSESYKVHKIKRILQAVEIEMQFPAFLFDVNENKSYYSSDNFSKITKYYDLRESDYWSPSKEFTKHTLCDYINMSRYRLVNPANSDEPRVSWIIMPIVMSGIVQAYFVVMESKEFIDFYDEYAIRIAFLMLQNLYEQMMFARNIGNIGFENYILFALSYKGSDMSRLVSQANIQGIDIHKKSVCILFQQMNVEMAARDYRKEFVDALEQSNLYNKGRVAFLDENEGLLLLDSENGDFVKNRRVEELIRDFQKYVQGKIPALSLQFSICCEEKSLSEIKNTINKCRRIMEMGKLLYPRNDIWTYEQLGPMVWLDIPSDELEKMLSSYRAILEDERNVEILKTLKIYLENNMNYSLTADKMFVHINTIRKRIERATQLVDIEWENYVARLRLTILLQYLSLD